MNKQYIYHNVRISILKDSIIRFEYVPTGNFSNEETLFVGKKKEEDFKLDIHEGDLISFNYQNLLVTFQKDNPLHTLKVYKENRLVYRYKGISNSGELPLPNKTPYIFPVMDAPRLILPLEGYDVDSTYIYEKDTKDLFLLVCQNDYKLLRKQYISLTGTNDMPRFKTLGLFNSRYYEWNEKTAKDMIEQYRKYRIPLDNFVLDTDWRSFNKTFGTGYNINTDLFPHLEKFYQYYHERNIEVMMNDHPCPLSKKHNVLNKEEIEYRKSNLERFLCMGLDTWWYDRNWIVSLISISKRIRHETLGRYLYQDITRRFYRNFVITEEDQIRPVTLSNITEISNGKYVGILDSKSHTTAFQWTGDIASEMNDITNEIKNMNLCSNNMIGYYSSDIGGHVGNPTKTEFVRWYQYGCFSPILRPHSTKSVIRHREPWVFGKKTLDIVREYIYMRYRLLNVIYTNAYKHVYEGLGIFRPLYINYPNDKKAYKEVASYMLGDNILISPICGEEKKPVLEKSYIDDVSVSFYKGRELKGKPILKKKLKKVDFSINNKPLYKGLPKYDFSARYKFKLKFNKDVDLYVSSDDGTRVFINDKRVLNDWTTHGESASKVSLLKKGVVYNIKIEYFQGLGAAALNLFYIEKKKQNRKTKIYLPEGEWYNLSHRNVYQGRRYIKEKYSIEETPLFVKAGSLLALYKNVDNTSNLSFKNIVYDFYPSREVITEDYFYEDDGLTESYKQGVFRINPYKLEFKDDHYLVTLFKSENNLGDINEIRNAVFKMHVRDGEKVTKVLINDEEIKFKRHDHNNAVYPFSSSEFSRDSKTCCFKFKQKIKDNYSIKIFVK